MKTFKINITPYGENFYYAPYFEEVEEAYWFGPVRPCILYYTEPQK